MTFSESPLLALQILLPVIANVVLLAVPIARLIGTPQALSPWMHELAAGQGWVALLLTAAVAAWFLWQTRRENLLHVLGGVALGCGVLVACGVESHDRTLLAHRGWISYHTLTTAWATAALLFFAIAMAGRSVVRSNALIEPWVTSISAATVLIATIHALDDPARPWWAAGAILAISLSLGLVAMVLRRPAQVYTSALLINLAGTIVWWAYSPSGTVWPDWTVPDLCSLVQANVFCLAIGSLIWSLLVFLPGGVPKAERLPPFAYLATQLGAILLGLVVATGIVNLFFELPQTRVERLDWYALAGITLSTVVCMRDCRARFPLPTLYGLGLCAVGQGLLRYHLTPRMFCWLAVNLLAAYSLITSLVALGLFRQYRRESSVTNNGSTWFSIVQMILVALTGTLALWIAIDFNFDGYSIEAFTGLPAGRLAAVRSLAFLLLTAIVMANVASKPWQTLWQYAALKMGVVLLCGFGWAILPADIDAPWLHRAAVVMVSSTFVGMFISFGLKQWLPIASAWNDRIRRAVPVMAVVAIGMLVAVLVQESLLFDLTNGAPMHRIATGTVVASLAGLIAELIVFAVMPQFDPLRLSDRWRQAYVYISEALFAAAGLHAYLTMPWLFQDYIVRYWMLIVMAVAFVWAGIAEWFHRRRLAVLSEPMSQTALFLPLLPAIGFFIAPTLAIDSPWHLVGRSPAVWLLMSLHYGILAIARRSWKCTALAILTANLGLWVGLSLSHFEFLQNPQLFVIPLALVGLLAEYLNHDRLSEAQSTAVRYLTLSAIYISSTADMFIAGLGNSWLLPLVLMVLSVAGMLAGMSLRVRSFLFLGFTFLVLDAMSMIWHAAYDLNHTWIWYVCGIALGAAILALFALFEKRRNDVLSAVERLNRWAK